MDEPDGRAREAKENMTKLKTKLGTKNITKLTDVTISIYPFYHFYKNACHFCYSLFFLYCTKTVEHAQSAKVS